MQPSPAPRVLTRRRGDDPLDGTGWAPDDAPARAFHRGLPSFAPTPLVDLPTAAARLGVARVLAKLETERAGLPAFKILGASWAAARAVHREWLAGDPRVPLELDAIRDAIAALRTARPDRRLALVTATDGNHGRGVARVAALLGVEAIVVMPGGAAPARVDAIAAEGAQVELVAGTYDEAVRRAASLASRDRLIVSDTSWPGYETTPRDVVDGYSTLFAELDDDLARLGAAPTHLVVQSGVGAFPAAAARHAATAWPHAAVVVVEPVDADCCLRSAEAGRLVAAPGPHPSAMAGLNCDLPSVVAWPLLDRIVDAFVAIADDTLPETARLLASDGVAAGESGMAGLAGLLAVARAGRLDELGIGPASTVLLVVTEGVTDPEHYARLLAG